MSDHDIDAVTDRYLRRYDLGRGMGFVIPRDSFLWANTRAEIASRRVSHALRGAGVSTRTFGRAIQRAAEAMERFAASLRREDR